MSESPRGRSHIPGFYGPTLKEDAARERAKKKTF